MKVTKNIFPIEWNLSDPLQVPFHGKKVFGTFVCAGGSTMGYKLAGFDHLGGVEFVNYYANFYKTNHKPNFFYEEDIRLFNERTDLPDDLYNLDLLDGSPPCTVFTTSGKREKAWGKIQQYENKTQRVDDLVYVYSETIKKLMPKVFLLENVQGLAQGNARIYLKNVIEKLSDLYQIQVFSLSAASMGIPQIRRHIFIIGIQKQLYKKDLELNFDCPPTYFNVTQKYWDIPGNELYSIENTYLDQFYDEIQPGKRHHKRFNVNKANSSNQCFTLMSISGASGILHHIQRRRLNLEEYKLLSTFPKDYNFGEIKTKADAFTAMGAMGNSVLPVMMANISHQIYEQWLKEL